MAGTRGARQVTECPVRIAVHLLQGPCSSVSLTCPWHTVGTGFLNALGVTFSSGSHGRAHGGQQLHQRLQDGHCGLAPSPVLAAEGRGSVLGPYTEFWFPKRVLSKHKSSWNPRRWCHHAWGPVVSLPGLGEGREVG